MTKPRIFYQPGSYESDGRFRIIYPDGRCEYAYDTHLWCGYKEYRKPCWAFKYRPKSQRAAIKAMREYDKSMNFEKAWEL